MFWKEIEFKEMMHILKVIDEEKSVKKLMESEEGRQIEYGIDRDNPDIGQTRPYTPSFFGMYDITKKKDGIIFKIRIDMRLCHYGYDHERTIKRAKKRYWYHIEKEIKFLKLSVK